MIKFPFQCENVQNDLQVCKKYHLLKKTKTNTRFITNEPLLMQELQMVNWLRYLKWPTSSYVISWNLYSSSKVLHYWPFMKGIHPWPMDSLTKGQYCGKHFHVTTSSCHFIQLNHILNGLFINVTVNTNCISYGHNMKINRYRFLILRLLMILHTVFLMRFSRKTCYSMKNFQITSEDITN